MMTDPPLVTIIIPSYNQGDFLEATIQSVLSQDYAPIEILLMDGGSTDQSLEIIQRYARHFAAWESQPDRGQAHAINKGLLKAKGQIIGWLNSDDCYLPGTVGAAVQTFLQEPAVEVVYGRLERIDEHGQTLPTPTLPKDRVEFGRELVLGECVVNQPGSFWRRTAMDRAGLLDESLRYALDYEYWIRLALLGARFKRLPQVVAQFRLSRNSKTVGQTAAMAGELLEVFEKIASSPDLSRRLDLTPAEIKRRVKKTRARFCLQAFYGEFKNRHWQRAGRWLWKALLNDPFCVFERRWLKLALAHMSRPGRKSLPS